QAVFDVTFLETLANIQQPLLVGLGTNPPTVTVGETTQGRAPDARQHEFPNFFSANSDNGNIKFSVFMIPNQEGGIWPTFREVNIYAAVTNWTETASDASLLNVYTLNGTNGANPGGNISADWATATFPGNYMANQGNYDSTILAVNQMTAFAGGHEID